MAGVKGVLDEAALPAQLSNEEADLKAKLLALVVALAGGALVAQPAAACMMSLPIFFAGPPPEGMTDRDEIARWESEQQELARAESREAAFLSYREHMAARGEEARGAEARPVTALAEDLAVSFVPPLLPRTGIMTSCGDLIGPEIRDPSGYPDEVGLIAERGLAPSGGEALEGRFLRRLDLRAAQRNYYRCTLEAVDRIKAILLREFTTEELAHVWREVHSHDFNRGRPWRMTSPNERQQERLLQFAGRWDGALVVAELASPNFTSPWYVHSPQVLQAQSELWPQLREFLQNDDIAQRMVSLATQELAGTTEERCPQAADIIAADEEPLREMIAEQLARAERSRQRRAAQ